MVVDEGEDERKVCSQVGERGRHLLVRRWVVMCVAGSGTGPGTGPGAGMEWSGLRWSGLNYIQWGICFDGRETK